MKKKQVLYLIFTVFLFGATLGIIWYFSNLPQNKINPLCEYVFVEKVYDGDTVKTDKLWKVRFLWIDAPEIYHPGWTKVKAYKFYWCWEEAKKFAEKYLLYKKILFCPDFLSTDKWSYWRYLRYAMIFTGWKQIPFGYILVKNWLAIVYKKASFSWKNKYLDAERLAKSKHIWIWSEKCIQQDERFKKKYLK